MGSWTTETCTWSNLTLFWWICHEVAWLSDDCTFFILEILLDVNSFLCVLIRWFVTKFHNLRWTENFLVAGSCNFIIVLFSECDCCSDLLERLTDRIVWCSLCQHNWVDCGSFPDRVRSDLLWSSYYSTFFVTASYIIQMLALQFSAAFLCECRYTSLYHCLPFFVGNIESSLTASGAGAENIPNFIVLKHNEFNNLHMCNLLTFQPPLEID